MFSGKTLVAIVDIDSVYDEETGDRKKIVSRETKLMLTVELVGIQTLQLGQMQGVNLVSSVEIPRIYYNNEKYCFFNDQLFVISNFSKAKSPTDMLLNVSKLDDNELEDVVREYFSRG